MNRKIVYGLGAVVVTAAIMIGFQSQNQSGPQDQSATPSATTPVAEGDPIAKVTLPASLSADAQIGKRGFDANCAQCHGANAAGQTGVAPPLVHKIYEPNHHSDIAFLRATKNGVRAHHWKFGNMAPVKGLTDADVKYITKYVRELQKENGIF